MANDDFLSGAVLAGNLGIVDVDTLLGTGGLGSLTYRASGAVGVNDVSTAAFAAPGEAQAFLGSPIVAGRLGLGVLAFLGRAIAG